jgi:hypothetical protein
MDFSESGGPLARFDLVLGCHQVFGESGPRKRLNPFIIMNDGAEQHIDNIFVFERGTSEPRHSLT